MLSNCRNNGHQVRFTSTVVSYHKNSFIVCRPLELELGKYNRSKFLRHLVRNNVGTDKLLRLTHFVCIAKLNNSFNRVKLYQISILHSTTFIVIYCQPTLSILLYIYHQQVSCWITPILGMVWLCVDEMLIFNTAVPTDNHSPVARDSLQKA